MYYLISPQENGHDRIMKVLPLGKEDVTFRSLPKPVIIAGSFIVGYPEMSMYDAVGARGGQAYNILMAALKDPEMASRVEPDFFTAWQTLCKMTDVKGRLPLLLLTDEGKIKLFTFNTEPEEEDPFDRPWLPEAGALRIQYEDKSAVHVRTFDVPTMFYQGNILRQADIQAQVDRRRAKQDAELARSFDIDNTRVGFTLQNFD